MQLHPSITKHLWKVLLIGLLALMLAACGSNEAAPSAAPTQAPNPTATPAAAEPTSPPAEEADQATDNEADAAEAVEATTTPAEPANEPAPQPEAVVNTKFNLNEASPEDFLTIPNVGDRMVREFFEYRPYISIQQFRREIGKYVDDQQVAAYEQYVFVPVNPNESDEATLQQLPGVDETISAELAAARPYESNEAFLAKLAQYVSAEDLALASSFLVAQ